jgi:hypothetical protein
MSAGLANVLSRFVRPSFMEIGMFVIGSFAVPCERPPGDLTAINGRSFKRPATAFRCRVFIGKSRGKGGAMRSAAECISKAEELSEIADSIFDADARTLVLTLAELWLDLSEQAQWQDSSSPVRAYRVQ